ncbi:major capsid protein [Curtobacterium flaccumfaciens]|uniref:major capsid protein n=1 Tax=Curtobacterium flaccumfaciens TaxID=2035 RepID=UPI00220700FA|nr:major capsid protein [Curtobacterium flaccumfaciens]UWD83652.1 major capsid protein [Curtobacterium flaccumfaciens]
MALWTDVIDPATLTGYARASLEEYEKRKGSLAQYLPNLNVADVVVRFVVGQTGLVQAAKFRAFDAEPEVGKAQGGRRVTLELPALGQNIPIGEYAQLRQRNASEDQQVASIQRTTDQVVQAVADAIEYLRGVVLNTGKATINQDNFKSEDDFGRPAGNRVAAAQVWSDKTVSRLADLEAWSDTYRDVTGEDPGSMLMSNRVFRLLASGDEFATQLLNGASRPATVEEVNAQIESAGLAPITRYDRKVDIGSGAQRVLPDNKLLLLPAPTDPNSEAPNPLGNTFWGQTLTSQEDAWGIEASEQPGVVAGVYRNEKPPVIAEVISDAIALPVLANAALSLDAAVV